MLPETEAEQVPKHFLVPAAHELLRHGKKIVVARRTLYIGEIEERLPTQHFRFAGEIA